jgi:hypothetical protein
MMMKTLEKERAEGLTGTAMDRELAGETLTGFRSMR